MGWKIGAALAGAVWAMCASAAMAQQGAAPFPRSFPTGQLPPKNVWQIADDGTALNLQSRLECPPKAGEFIRISVQIYNAFGTDVSCGYQNLSRDTITLYIMLRGAQAKLEQEFNEARYAIVMRASGATPLTDAEQQTFMSDVEWRHALYRVNGATRTGLWMTRFGGWNVEFRATYAESRTDPVFAAMSALSATAQKTAGEHIAACFAMMPVMRDGHLIMNPGMATRITVTGMLTAQSAAGSSPNWCVVQALTINGAQWLLWRNAAAQNGGAADRLTSAADENGPVIYTAADTFWQKTWKDGDERPTAPYDIAIETADAIELVGVYEGRPTIQQLANVMRPTIPLYAHLDKATKRVTVYRLPLPAPSAPLP